MKTTINKVDEYAAFVEQCRDLDAVVFVHGLDGDFAETWKQFPELIATDNDLPELDVFLWGYPTGILKKRKILDIPDLAQQYISALISHLPNAEHMHLVGHSMGGLITLQGLISELLNDRAGDHPTRAVNWISLFASPVSGSTASTVVQHIPVLSLLLNEQTLSLGDRQEIDDMITEVFHRIYPEGGNGESTKYIPIRMIMATNDAIVSDSDRQRESARFRNIPPLELGFGHSDIKEPEDHDDPRYKALANDLKQGFVTQRFQTLASSYLNGNEQEKNAAAIQIQSRYMRIFLRVYEAHGGTANGDDRFLKFVETIMAYCRETSMPPAVCAREVARAFRYRGDLPQ